MTRAIRIKILDPRIGDRFPLPRYATPGAGAMDLHACLDGPLTLAAQEVALVGTGVAVHIAEPELAGVVLPRSGLGHRHGLVLGNLVGLIDSDYQGEIKLSCWNRGNSSFTIQPGDRIAQLAFIPWVRASWQVVEMFEETSRGQDGFGHTGKAAG